MCVCVCVCASACTDMGTHVWADAYVCACLPRLQVDVGNLPSSMPTPFTKVSHVTTSAPTPASLRSGHANSRPRALMSNTFPIEPSPQSSQHLLVVITGLGLWRFPTFRKPCSWVFSAFILPCLLCLNQWSLKICWSVPS